MALSPNGALLIAADGEGHAVLCSVAKRVVLHHFAFKEPIGVISFSPDGDRVVVTSGIKIKIWRAPAGDTLEFAPLVLEKTFTGHTGEIVSLDWTRDGRFLLSASRDMTARIYDLKKDELNPQFRPIDLRAHRHPLEAAYFSSNDERIFTIGRNGSLFVWRFHTKKGILLEMEPIDRRQMMTEAISEAEEKDRIEKTAETDGMFKSKITSVAFNKLADLVVVGFANGVFAIYTIMPFERVYSLGVTQARISSIAINSSGEWLALGVADHGQLLVWEWRSETFVLKQQGHTVPMNCLAYSHDGQVMATGSADGKVKLWNARSGLSFVTFSEHRASVSGVEFTKNSKVVVSASNDGTVRAYDLLRYRNFRTFTTPTPVQFFSLAVDPSGEIVAAGTLDTFEIYLWSMQTGQLLEVISGHTGPISSLVFDPVGHLLASGSWDRTTRLWEVFQRDKNMQILDHSSDVLAAAFRPDGQEIAVATLRGEIVVWNAELASVSCTIECRRDYAEKPLSVATMRSLCYSPDGSILLAAGSFPFIALYEVASRVLLRRFAVVEMRRGKLEEPIDMEVFGVKMSPTGRAFAALSKEGLAIFSFDDTLTFDPFDLEIDLTPETIHRTLDEDKNYLKAFVMALRLNVPELVEDVWTNIPPDIIPLIARNIPHRYLSATISFFAKQASRTHRLGLLLQWIVAVFEEHALEIKVQRHGNSSVLGLLHKHIQLLYGDLAKVGNDTLYTLDFVAHRLSVEKSTT